MLEEGHPVSSNNHHPVVVCLLRSLHSRCWLLVVNEGKKNGTASSGAKVVLIFILFVFFSKSAILPL